MLEISKGGLCCVRDKKDEASAVLEIRKMRPLLCYI